MTTQRSYFGFIVAGIIAVVLVAIAGLYSVFARSPVSVVASGSSQAQAAVFVSKLAPVTVSLLVNPEDLQSLDSSGGLSKLKSNILNKSGIDYRQDIQPWLKDEITLAVTTLDIDRDPENGKQPGYLMALATDKPEKSREFVELLFSKRVLGGASLDVEEYQGAKVLTDGSLAATQVNNFVLFANDGKVLRDAINNIQAPDLNLLSSPQYQKATEKLPQGSFATAFLNFPNIAKWQDLDLPEPTYDSEIIALTLNPQGVLAETNFLATSEIAPTFSSLSEPVGALQYIPGDAGLVISGADLAKLADSNLAKLWQQIQTAISGSGTDIISRLVQPLVGIEKTWGINLDKDIFSWVKGEYAIALLPRDGQALPDWVFVTEKLDNLPAAIGNLDAIATSKGLNTNNINLGKQQVTAWTELTADAKQADKKDKPKLTVEAKVKGVHTTLDNYEIFASDLTTISQVLNNKDKEKNFLNNPSFKNSIAAIPQPNQGYVYVDWTKNQNLLEQQVPIFKLIEVLGKPFFENLRSPTAGRSPSLTFSSYGSDAESLKAGVFLQLNN